MIYLLCALLFDSAIGKDDDMNWKKLLGMYGIVLVGVWRYVRATGKGLFEYILSCKINVGIDTKGVL